MSGLITKATSDDTSPVPVYTLREMADLTMQSIKESDNLRAGLLARLSRQSPDVKFKTLRVIKYICLHGRVEFKMSWQRDNAAIKTCLQFQCPPDELRGDRPAENVRNEAQACLEAIFSETAPTSNAGIAVESYGSGPTVPSANSYGTQPQTNDDSITGLNLRKNIVNAFLGDKSKPVYTPTASKYGGYGSDGGSSSNNQYPSSFNTANSGFHQNGIYGGNTNDPASYANAQEHGYGTHQPQQGYGGAHANNNNLHKAGPWGTKPSSTNNTTTASSTGSLPPQEYIARNGPSTRNSVEDLGFEKRIVAQYTTNTPLKPTLTDLELKKFTNESSSSAIDDILIILFDICSTPNQTPATLSKATQLYGYIVQQCGIVAQECDKEHITFFHNLYQKPSNNKHVQNNLTNLLVQLKIIDNVAVTSPSSSVPQAFRPTKPQNEPQSFQTNETFDFLSSNNNNDQQQQVAPTQPAASAAAGGKKKVVFNKRPVKKTTSPSTDVFATSSIVDDTSNNNDNDDEGSSFAFIGGSDDNNETEQVSTQTTQTTTNTTPDLFALLGNTSPQQNTGGLDLNALYAQPATTTTTQQPQPATTDIFANITQFSQPQQQTDPDDAFAFLTNDKVTQQQPEPVKQTQAAALNDAFADLNF